MPTIHRAKQHNASFRGQNQQVRGLQDATVDNIYINSHASHSMPKDFFSHMPTILQIANLPTISTDIVLIPCHLAKIKSPPIDVQESHENHSHIAFVYRCRNYHAYNRSIKCCIYFAAAIYLRRTINHTTKE